MKIHIHLNQEDYIQFNIFHMFHSEVNQKPLLLGRIRYFILSPLFILLVYFMGTNQTTLINLIVFSVIYSTIWYFINPLFVKRNIRKNINKMSKEGKLAYSEDSIFEFGETEIIETCPDSVTHFPYASILNIVETEIYIYIMVGASQALIIPIRDISDDKAALLALLNEKCNHITHI